MTTYTQLLLEKDLDDRRRARQEQAEADRARAMHIREQATAAEALAGKRLSTELRMQIRHVFALAAVEPAIRIEMIERGSRAEALLGANNAMATPSKRLVIVPVIREVTDVATVLHELGHNRTSASRTLSDEVAAWRWAITHSLAWSHECHAEMGRSLNAYIVATTERTHQNILDVREVERFVAEFQPKFIPTERLLAFERELFVEEHGEQVCRWTNHGRQHVPAVARVDRWFVCRQCRPLAEGAVLDRSIRAMRAERAGGPPSAVLTRDKMPRCVVCREPSQTRCQPLGARWRDRVDHEGRVPMCAYCAARYGRGSVDIAAERKRADTLLRLAK